MPIGTTPNSQINGNPYQGTVSGNTISGSTGYSIGANHSYGFGSVTLSAPASRAPMHMKWMANNSIQLILCGEENNQFVNMLFTPEQDITPTEQHHITMLVTLLSTGGGPNCAGLMGYVRKHSLERHFTFTPA